MNSILLPIIMALVAGHAPAAAAMLGAITAQQWVTLGASALQDAPDVIKAFNALPVPQSGVEILPELERAVITGVVSQTLKDWIAANEQFAISVQDQSIRNQR
jgi:hypothetical protein